MPARTWHWYVLASWVVCLATSYQSATGQVGMSEMPQDPTEAPLEVFAHKGFYRQRVEPEEVLIGVLRRSPVREGPDTRDMPFRLVMGHDELAVYSSGFDEHELRPYVDHEVQIVGKRIDQREEGYGIEIWIATIRRR